MKQAPWIIIAALLVVIVLMRECQRPCPECPEPVIKTDTIKGDTVAVPYPVIVPKYITKVVHDTIPIDVDTAAILADYFAKVYGTDTLANDSSVFVSVDWMVMMNQLMWIRPHIMNRRATVVYQTVMQMDKPRNRYFAGLGVGRSPNEFGLAPSVALLTKRQNLYTLNYDVLNQDIYFTVYFKLYR